MHLSCRKVQESSWSWLQVGTTICNVDEMVAMLQIANYGRTIVRQSNEHCRYTQTE